MTLTRHEAAWFLIALLSGTGLSIALSPWF